MTQNKGFRIRCIVIIFAWLCLWTGTGSAFAAQITGTVYEDDGATPVAASGYVYVYTELCGSGYVGYGWFNADEGIFTVQSLPAGTYYLYATTSYGNYLDEWWADPLSTLDCNSGETVTVGADDTAAGINFQLDTGGQISGTVYEQDGTTPVNAYGYVQAYTGPCGSGYAGEGYFSGDDGSYTIQGLPTGSYYLYAYTYGNHLDEWWADPLSTLDCNSAQPVAVTAGNTVAGRDFQLDTGAQISGTVYESDGTTPLTASGYVYAYTGPCGSGSQAGYGYFSAD